MHCWSPWPEVYTVVWINVLFANYGWCLPLPRLSCVVLRKVGQSSQSAAIRQHVEHLASRGGLGSLAQMQFQILA